MGIEASFYVQDKEKPDLYAFNPCGHVATEKTVKYVISAKYLYLKIKHKIIWF
jgi:hypothetical protein